MSKLQLTFLLVSILLSSCVKELVDKADKIEDITYNPTVAFPLATGDFSIGELAEELSDKNFTISEGNDGTTVFVYDQPSIFSKRAGELFAIPNQHFSTDVSAGYDIPGGAPSETIETTSDESFDFNSPEGDKIHQITLKGGSLNVVMTGNIPATGSIHVEFSSIKIDELPLSIDYSWNTSNYQTHSDQIDLTNAVIDLTRNNTSFNQFDLISVLTINYNGSAVSASDGFNLDINLVNLKFELLTATFGKRDITSEESSFDLNFTDEIMDGDFFLQEPSLLFTVHNSIGAPVRINLGNIKGSFDNSDPIYLNGSFVETPIDINYPSGLGSTEETTVIADETNSNLNELISAQPHQIDYAFWGTVNPLESDEIHFVHDTSSIISDVLLEVPMYGYIKDLIIHEPYEMDGSFFEDVDNAMIRLSIDNGLPMEAFVQGYFLNTYGEKLDSIILDQKLIIPAAITDENGNVIENSNSVTDINIDSSRAERLIDTKTLEIKLIMNTPETPEKLVRFSESNKIKINILGQTKFDFKF